MDQSPTPPPGDAGKPLVNQAGQLDFEALAQRQGLFNPPAGFDHGPEFEPAKPRPVPGRLRRGSYGSRRWSTVLTLLVLGIGCVIFKPIPFIERLSWHVLPLGYLHWIGYGLIALAVIKAISNRFSRDRYRYVVEGDPIVGRALGIFAPVSTTVDPQTNVVSESFRYLAVVEYVDPETQKIERIGTLTEEEWNNNKQVDYDAGVDAGEYVTLVKLPGQGTDSVRLYGFLGLDPDRDFVTKDGRPLTGVSPYTAVLISTVVLLALWFLILAIYVFTYCEPREEPDLATGLTFLGGGALAGFIVAAWLTLARQRKHPGSKIAGLTLAAFFGGVFGLLAGFVSLGAINAAFDHTQPTYEPIRITQHWNTTHNLVFRTYEIEYAPLGGGKSEKHGTSVDDLEKLGNSTLGALEIRQGALGLDWIAGVHPVGWHRIEGEPTAEEVATGILVEGPDVGGARTGKMAPHLIVARDDETGDTTAPCPPDLAEAAITDMTVATAPLGFKIQRLKK
ncbi:MAG TPA: hypothetical protein VM452_03990 [Caulifigura sp.]|jgi:hypothetical protein|nr:hypothetical protein [Caulifigura sp.]